MTSRSRRLSLLPLALGTLVLAACGGGGPKPEATLAATPTPTPSPCTAQASWATNPSQPDFNADPQDHCAFYQYAWQSFLYLTSPSAGAGSPAIFETWPSIDQVFGSATTQLTAARSGKLFTAVDPRSKTRKKRFFRQRVNKPVSKLAADGTPIGGEDTQAGSGGILVDQTGNITYYEQFFDPGEAVPFFDACTLTVKACWTAPGAAKLRFPAGSIELKVSWRPLWKTTPDVDSFYLIPGSPVQNAAGKLVTPDYFGLVGFHLVYTTPGQPEMVWATFEHVDNAPDAPCVNGQQTCGQLPAGFSGWSYNACKSTSCANVNQWPLPSPTPSPLPNTQAFLEYALGTQASITDAAGVSGADNISIIEQLNQSVLGVLPAGSVWRNYYFSGAIWTLDGVLPAVPYYSSSGKPNGSSFNEVGSTLLANATMETFTQFPNPIPSPFPSPAPVQNCFTCHNATPNPSPTPSPSPSPQGSFLVSHARQAAAAGNCSWSATPPAACTATQPSPSP